MKDLLAQMVEAKKVKDIRERVVLTGVSIAGIVWGTSCHFFGLYAGTALTSFVVLACVRIAYYSLGEERGETKISK